MQRVAAPSSAGLPKAFPGSSAGFQWTYAVGFAPRSEAYSDGRSVDQSVAADSAPWPSAPPHIGKPTATEDSADKSAAADSAPLPDPPLTEDVPGAEPDPAAETAKTPSPALNDQANWAAINRQTGILKNAFFQSQVLTSLGLDDKASVTAVRLFLVQFREEAGASNDPVEKVLLDQLIVAHLKVGELYALAAETTKLEFKQLYSGAAARLLSGICQLVSTLTSYRASLSSRQKRKGRQPRKSGPKNSAQKGRPCKKTEHQTAK